MMRSLTPLALAVLFALFSEASAAVVYYTPPGGILIPNTSTGVSVDLESNLSSTDAGGLSGGDANFFLGGSRVSNDGDEDAVAASWQPVRSGTGNTDAILNLNLGTTIDGSTSFYSTGFGASGQINSHMVGGSTFTDGASGYLGFSLVIDDPLAPGNDLTVYGWARVSFENNDGTGILHEWAYEDSGAAIDVGQIPEPSVAILVLIGSMIGLLRRRR